MRKALFLGEYVVEVGSPECIVLPSQFGEQLVANEMLMLFALDGGVVVYPSSHWDPPLSRLGLEEKLSYDKLERLHHLITSEEVFFNRLGLFFDEQGHSSWPLPIGIVRMGEGFCLPLPPWAVDILRGNKIIHCIAFGDSIWLASPAANEAMVETAEASFDQLAKQILENEEE